MAARGWFNSWLTAADICPSAASFEACSRLSSASFRLRSAFFRVAISEDRRLLSSRSSEDSRLTLTLSAFARSEAK